MSKWTPGEWKVGERIGEGNLTIINKIGFNIAYVNQFAESFKDKKDLANARLIASAPDLLEACKYALRTFKDSDCAKRGLKGWEACIVIDQAIAKAEEK